MTTNQAALMQVLADFARTLVRPYAIGDVLYRLGDGIVEVFDVAGAGVALDDGRGKLRFVSATDDVTAHIERVQEEAQEGPCRSAFESGQPMVVEDVTTLAGWPAVTAAATAADRRAILGLPMRLDDDRVGSVNIYASGPRHWTDEDVKAAMLLADVATGYVLNGRALERSRRTVGQLEVALESRIIIEQAKGVLASERGVPIDAAFAPLRAYSRTHNIKIHEVARRVVEEGLRP